MNETKFRRIQTPTKYEDQETYIKRNSMSYSINFIDNNDDNNYYRVFMKTK